MENKIIQGDCLESLKKLESGSIQCCITSPPYWGLRDYGVDGQLGLEKTPEEYVAKMVAIFAEVKRILRDDGTLWLNLGDSYAGSGKGIGSEPDPKWDKARNDESKHKTDWSNIGLKPKDLVGVPWRVAFALQADGWYLRSDIIWNKPNPMPESVKDRPTKSHEYIFLLSKKQTYYYDQEAVRESQSEGTIDRYKNNNKIPSYNKTGGSARKSDSFTASTPMAILTNGRNLRSVWTFATQPVKEAHFATYPEELVRRCMMAGTSEKGQCAKCGSPWERIVERKAENHISRADRQEATGGAISGGVGKNFPDIEIQTLGWQPTCDCNADVEPQTILDPFFGSGTTGIVACRGNRRYIGIELNPEYVKIAEKRLKPYESNHNLL